MRVLLLFSILVMFDFHAAARVSEAKRPAPFQFSGGGAGPRPTGKAGLTAGGCWSCDVDFGNLLLSQSYEWEGWYMFAEGDVTISFGPRSFSGSSDFVVTEDGCAGNTLEDSSCPLSFHFAPTAEGDQSATVTFPAQICQTVAPFNCHNSVATWILRGTSRPVIPEKPCIECGSLIQVDGQSMIESIPIAGTPFSLNYASANAGGYVSVYNTLGTKSHFNPHAWTVSAHHYFDPVQHRLYRGTGTSEVLQELVMPSGNLLVVSGAGDEVYIFAPNGKHLQTKTFLTGATKYTFAYSGGGRLVSITDAFNNVTAFTLNGSGQLTQIEAPFGQVSTVALSGGRIASLTNPNSETHAVTYKSGTDLLETFTKPGSRTSTFTYDANGRLTRDLGPGGNHWDLTASSITSKMGRTKGISTSTPLYDGYIRTETLPDGNVRNYYQAYDGAITESDHTGVEVSTVAPDERFGDIHKRRASYAVTFGGVTGTTTEGQTVSYGTGSGFFGFATLSQTTTFAGQTFSRVFDKATMTWSTASPEGATSSTVLNAHEQPVQYQTGGDTAWSYTYDAYGRLAELIQGTHNRLTLTYNGAGHVANVQNVRNENTGFTYDLAGRVTQITLPDARVIAYSYDADGNVTGVTPPGRPQHAFVFNSMELLGTYQPPSLGLGITKDTSYAYNDDKQLINITRPDGAQIDFTYDATKGRLTTITNSLGNYVLTYSTASQQLVRKTSPYGIRSDFTWKGRLPSSDAQLRTSDGLLFGKTSFTYDADHRLSSRSIQGNSSTPTYTINYSYNDDSRLSQVGDLSLSYTYPSGRLSGTTLDNVTDTFTYDTYGQLESYTAVYSSGGTPTTLYSYTLTRDNGGRITGKSEAVQGTTKAYAYTYDSAGRLTQEAVNGTSSSSFTYDSNSNRTSGTVDGVSFTATYDDQDRILTYNSRTYTHNRNGDLTQIQWNVSQQSQFVYDEMGNLKQVTLPSGTLLEYVHDGLDRRVVKKSGGTFVARWLYEDQHRISAVINGSNAVAKEFVHATRVNVPDYMIVSGVKYRIITDHLGSPRLVVRTDTGAVSQRIDYNVLGEVKIDTNAGFQPFGFAGGLYDSATQLVRFGARDYDPRAGGRWTTKDPVRFQGNDTNLYGYALNDPVNLVDTNGKWAVFVAYAAFEAGFFFGATVNKAFFNVPYCQTYQDANPMINLMDTMVPTSGFFLNPGVHQVISNVVGSRGN